METGVTKDNVTLATQGNSASTPDFAFFNDNMRDGLKEAYLILQHSDSYQEQRMQRRKWQIHSWQTSHGARSQARLSTMHHAMTITHLLQNCRF